MEIMYDRKTGRRYEVYGIDVDHKTALCYDSSQATRQNGAGWTKISIKPLIPEAYFDKVSCTYMSKTERNEIKSNLKLVDAIWECTDGTRFTHEAIEHAIDHQRQLLNCVTDTDV